MGIEALNSAARAAGYAMVELEEPLNQGVESKVAQPAWQAGNPVLARHGRVSSAKDWVKSLFGMFGRGAPA